MTIVAVFLALGLGLLAGSSFGQPALVGQLRERTDAQLERIDALRGEAEELGARNADLTAFADAALPYLVEGRLEGIRVVVVTQEGVAGETEAVTLDALARAGATVVLTVALEPAIVEPASAASLSTLVGAGGPAAAIADRLMAEVAPAAATDVLVGLLEGGFLATRDAGLDEATREAVHGGGLVVVVLGGASPGDPPLATTGIAVELVRTLAERGVVVAAGEGTDAPDAWVDGVAAPTVVTVVGLDASSGAGALVLGLRDRLLTGRGGAYGPAATPLP